jgi:hypothetical protein
LCGVGGPYSLHPDFLESQLTRSQILEWQAFYRIRPFGSKRDDIRSGTQTYWLLSGLLTDPPADHSPKKYQLQFGDGPPLNEAETILQRIRNRLAGSDE